MAPVVPPLPQASRWAGGSFVSQLWAAVGDSRDAGPQRPPKSLALPLSPRPHLNRLSLARAGSCGVEWRRRRL
eukprot:787748-Pyramimonas_sp.AAC.1